MVSLKRFPLSVILFELMDKDWFKSLEVEVDWRPVSYSPLVEFRASAQEHEEELPLPCTAAAADQEGARKRRLRLHSQLF